jgi:hypothetical protein
VRGAMQPLFPSTKVQAQVQVLLPRLSSLA